MTIDDMRAVLGLGAEVPDADVTAAYVIYLEAQPSTAAPLALPDLKKHLNIEADVTADDSYLELLIAAAQAACEDEIHRSIAGGAKVLVLDRFPLASPAWSFPTIAHDVSELEITLPGGGVSSVTSITYSDADGVLQTLDPGTYVAELVGVPARIAPVSTWPATKKRPGAITISFVAAGLPADKLEKVAQAMRLLIGTWYANREHAAVDVRGVPTEIPNAFTWLLRSTKLWATE